MFCYITQSLQNNLSLQFQIIDFVYIKIEVQRSIKLSIEDASAIQRLFRFIYSRNTSAWSSYKFQHIVHVHINM